MLLTFCQDVLIAVYLVNFDLLDQGISGGLLGVDPWQNAQPKPYDMLSVTE